jgi:hypothetical protein
MKSRPHGPVPLDRVVRAGNIIEVTAPVPILMVIDNLANTYYAQDDGAWAARNNRTGRLLLHVVTADTGLEVVPVTVQEWGSPHAGFKRNLERL